MSKYNEKCEDKQKIECCWVAERGRERHTYRVKENTTQTNVMLMEMF